MRLCYLLPLLLAALIHGVASSVAGVDFGGEFFKIALVKPGRPFEIVTNVHSKRKTETIVSFNGEERVYGADAMNIEVRRPQVAYSQIRRFLGTTMEHPMVASLTENEYFPYTLTSNLTRGSVALKHNAEYTFHAEELAAMVFGHAKQITNDFAESSVKDWVITVPMYFAEPQRQAIIDAAEIAGVRVLSLVDENTAAALHHAVDYSAPEPNTPERIMYYNMGSTSLQVSIVEYNTRVVPDGFKKNKTIVEFEVLSKAWDETLGGAAFDLRLAEKFASEFNAKLKTGEDVRQIPRAMAKLRAAARKTKIVLSANEAIPVIVPSLHADLDYKGEASRAEFEKIAADLFARVLGPAESALSQAGLTVADLHAVEIIGGGVRIPKIQTLLTDFVQRDLGRRLNGDEAMALGAAFNAANLSTSFRVRHIGMTDIASFPVGVRLVDLEAHAADDDHPEAKHWVKRAALFGERQKLNVKKSVSFSHAEDVSCTFRYDKPSALPEGVSAIISRYNITGIEAFAKQMADKQLGEPKVTLSFSLDASGLATIVKAEATLEEEIEVPAPTKKAAKDAKKAASDSSKADDDSGSDAAEDAKADAKVDSETEDKADDKEAAPEMIKKKKVHRVALTVVRADAAHRPEAGMAILPMTFRDKKDSIAMLAAMDKADGVRKANAEAKNRLEAFVYESREYLSSHEDVLEAVTTAAQREALSSAVDATEEWLYDDGDDLEAKAYNDRLAGMRTQLDDMVFRVTELTALPEAVAKVQQYAISTIDLMAQWIDVKPQVTEEERADILAKVSELKDWLKEQQAAQDALPKHETPVLTSAQIVKKIQNIKKLVSTLSKKKPLPKPTEEPKKDDEAAPEATAEPTPEPTPEATEDAHTDEL
ncbi:hsp70-like protein [Achlya hypogyna]|nr:hsp70-like protein [Achlya hypogyna]